MSNQWMAGTSSLISSLKYRSLGRIVLPLGAALGIGFLAGSILAPILSQGKVSFRDDVGFFDIFPLGLGICLRWQTLPMSRAKKQKVNGSGIPALHCPAAGELTAALACLRRRRRLEAMRAMPSCSSPATPPSASSLSGTESALPSLRASRSSRPGPAQPGDRPISSSFLARQMQASPPIFPLPMPAGRQAMRLRSAQSIMTGMPHVPGGSSIFACHIDRSRSTAYKKAWNFTMDTACRTATQSALLPLFPSPDRHSGGGRLSLSKHFCSCSEQNCVLPLL
ncbi:MAG: hypothetical protein J6P53_01585 [Mailhella sp.]|nr:hypothetical protein [Mailhella sp.]